MAQRDLSPQDIDYVLKNGHRWFGLGAEFRFLRRKDIAIEDRAKSEIARLEGTALVITSKDRDLITIWRNRKYGSRRIKRKPKRGPFCRSG